MIGHPAGFLHKENAVSAETSTPKPQGNIVRNIYRGGGDAVYGLGLIGALIYYIQHATTLAMGLLGLLKAVVWPALLVYKVVETLGL